MSSSSSSILTALSSSPQLSNDDTKAINSENSAKDVNDDVKRESSNNNSDSARIPSQLDSSPSHNDSTLLAASLNSNNTTNTNHNHNHNKKSSNHHNKSSTNNNNHNFHLDATETAPSLGATASQQQTTSKLTNSLTLTNHNNNNAHCSTTHKKKTRTMFPMQQKNYGPKATLKKVTEDYLLLVQDPLSQQLSWTKPPLHVLVLKKICNALFEPFNEIVRYLIYEHNLIVYVEENDFEHEIFRLDEQIKAAMTPRGNQLKPSLRKFCQPSPNYCCRNTENTDVNKIDLVVCLGGDGTLLHASGLFQKSCPPVLSIHMGSLGFLCPFDFDDYREYMNGVIKGGVPILLRNRIKFRVEKSEPLTTGIDQQSSIMNGVSNSVDDELNLNEERHPPTSTPSTSPPPPAVPEELIALNEVVISRGPSPYLSNLDLYINDYLMTTVQGDGLIISTPTGSTAYAMAAGASMCHPSVQSIIIAPICPHSLSFRPIVVPAGVELKIALNDDARHPSAWYSVDGRNTAELKQGYHISITASEFPVPSICRTDQVSDWFEGLATCLHWNQRQKQLPANACYQKDSRGQSLASPQSNSLLHSSLSSKSSSTSSLKFFGGNNNNHSNNNTNTIAHSTTSSNFSSKSISENEQHVASKLSEFGIESEDSGI